VVKLDDVNRYYPYCTKFHALCSSRSPTFALPTYFGTRAATVPNLCHAGPGLELSGISRFDFAMSSFAGVSKSCPTRLQGVLRATAQQHQACGPTGLRSYWPQPKSLRTPTGSNSKPNRGSCLLFASLGSEVGTDTRVILCCTACVLLLHNT